MLVLRSLLAALVFMSAGALAAQTAVAQKRVAFVVGNNDYKSAPDLKNAASDGADIAAALRALGFDVISGQDVSIGAFGALRRQFLERAQGADVALFYYAGHAIQFQGTNYLQPVDAAPATEDDLDVQMIAAQDILGAMEQRARVTLVFLDACRNNPVTETLYRNAGIRFRSGSTPRGLARMSVKSANTLLVFAAEAGKVALDGSGRNSPFTTAMLKHLPTPGLDIELAMKRVTRDVQRATNGRQLPERLSRLTSDLVLRPAAGIATAPQTNTIAGLSPGRPLAGQTVPRQGAPSATAGSGPDGCIRLPNRRLAKPITVRAGTVLCSADGSIRAEVRRAVPWAVIFAQDGRDTSCGPGDLCSFRWAGAPAFTTRPAGRDEAGQQLWRLLP